jgi:hypothetical protein
VLAQIEQARRERRHQLLWGMVMNRHERSPNNPRNRFIASRSLDFTVPSGI